MDTQQFHRASAPSQPPTPRQSPRIHQRLRRHTCASWILLLLLALPAVVQAQFDFTTNSDGITLTINKYTGSGGDVTIPDTTNGLSVTGIGTNAFSYSLGVTNVTIAYSITNIGASAFAASRFAGLRTITVDTNNSAYSSLDGVLFDKNQTTLIQCPLRNCKSYVIPDSVTCVGDDAFHNCAWLTNITIGNIVTSIGSSTFYLCSGLTNIVIGNSVTSIGSNAFYYCTNLVALTIPDSVTSFGSSTFYSCYKLTSVTLGTNVTSIGSDVTSLFRATCSVGLGRTKGPDDERQTIYDGRIDSHFARGGSR